MLQYYAYYTPRDNVQVENREVQHTTQPYATGVSSILDFNPGMETEDKMEKDEESMVP